MRKKLLLAFGDPINCPANPNQVKPSQEKLDLYHGRLVRGFKDTFDTHKTAYGWGDRTLELV